METIVHDINESVTCSTPADVNNTHTFILPRFIGSFIFFLFSFLVKVYFVYLFPLMKKKKKKKS